MQGQERLPRVEVCRFAILYVPNFPNFLVFTHVLPNIGFWFDTKKMSILMSSRLFFLMVTYNRTMSSPSKPTPTTVDQPVPELSLLPPPPLAREKLNPSTGHFANETVYRIEEAVLPLTFARISTKARVLATRTVVRVLILSFKVRASNRSPSALTFVPVFLTDEGDVLDPGTCDIVGRYEEDDIELNPSFVQKHECGKAKVRNVHVKFDLSPKDLDFYTSMFDPGDATDSNPTSSSVFGMSPISRKMAAKRTPGKYNPPFGTLFANRKGKAFPPMKGMKRMKEDSSSPKGEKREEFDSDIDLDSLIDETLGFECDVPPNVSNPFPSLLKDE